MTYQKPGMTPNLHHFEFLESPFGNWRIEATEKGICCIKLVENVSDESNPSKITKQAVKELKNYFKGTLRRFSVPLDLKGTEFQQKVWKEVSYVEYGSTKSYAFVANEIGNPEAVRAVGTANGSNPVPIVIPCHRIVGSNGTLTGYAYGVKLKEELLKLEGAIPKTLFD